MVLRLKLKTYQRIYPPSSNKEIVLNKPIKEEAPMKSSCVAPEDGGVESAKEKDERTILDEPMVAKALELFAPKRVRVKRRS